MYDKKMPNVSNPISFRKQLTYHQRFILEKNERLSTKRQHSMHFVSVQLEHVASSWRFICHCSREDPLALTKFLSMLSVLCLHSFQQNMVNQKSFIHLREEILTTAEKFTKSRKTIWLSVFSISLHHKKSSYRQDLLWSDSHYLIWVKYSPRKCFVRPRTATGCSFCLVSESQTPTS